VLVLPGFGATDRSTVGLRTQLSLIGHPVHRWHLGRNEGPTKEIIEGLGARFAQLFERYDRPIALVGWSLGGIYAWGIAQRVPEQVQQVITLGSPLNSTGMTAGPPPVPLTSIWSRNDRVVNWRSSLLETGAQRENIEVRATHLTLGFDPLVGAAIADRLGQRPDRWKPFNPPSFLDPAFPKQTDRATKHS
jgi:pimeloyl-ACP methyl ester carboxylesterase